MKKVLFASTALVAFAGAASAEVLLTGQAEMGILSSERLNGDITNGFVSDNKVGFFTDLDVTFTMAGETDGGLTFGANIDLDEGGDGAPFENPTRQGGEAIFLSGAFGTLTAGDTDGALDFALTEVAFNSGSLADDETIHAGFNGNRGLDGLYDGQIVRYDYSFGDFGVAVSAELDDTDGDGNDNVYGIGAKYQLDLGGSTVGLGAGFQTASVADVNVDTYGLSINGEIAGFAVGLSYMSYNNHIPAGSIADGNFGAVVGGAFLTPGSDSDHIGVGVGYTTGAISASFNYGQYSLDDFGDIDGYGLTVGYDLGGGASVQFGYGHSDYSDLNAQFVNGDGNLETIDTADTFSLGVRMNF